MADIEKEAICRKLDESAKENSIICIDTISVLEKEIVLNYMIKKGWICVQNDISCTKSWKHFTLTFATKEAAASFKV